jgi:nucleoside triphosphatase
MADQLFPEPTVGVFIFNPAGELLLLKSHKWPGKYVVPGGHVELGERIEQAAIREAREETGLEVYDLRFICFQQFIRDPSFWKPRHFIFFDFACRTDSREVKLNDEAEAHAWAGLEAALLLPLDSYTRFSVEKLIAGGHLSQGLQLLKAVAPRSKTEVR